MSGSKSGQRIVVAPKQVQTIGRSTAAQNSFEEDDHMSAIHFEVENFGDYAEVRDRRSTNRTWLNNTQIASAQLKPGDRIRAGKTVLLVEVDTGQAAERAAPAVVRPGPPQAGSFADHRPAPPPMPTPAPVDIGPAARTPLPDEIPVPPPVQYPKQSVQPPIQQPIQPLASQPVLPPRSMPHNHSPVQAPGPMAMQPPAPVRGPSMPQRFAGAPAVAAPPPTGSRGNSPIEESVEFSVGPSASPVEVPLAPTPGNPNNPITESGSWVYVENSARSPGSIKRRFRMFERDGDFQTIHNLRTIINAMRMKKSIRVIAHFNKIRMTTPESLTQAAPVYPSMPGAMTHLPVALTWNDWESDAVQGVATRLCANDALLVVIAAFNTPIEAQIQSVGEEGIPGFCEPGGFLGWCWPSAFLSLMQMLGIRKWTENLGATIEGVVMYSPTHSQRIVAVAEDTLADELLELGFRPEV